MKLTTSPDFGEGLTRLIRSCDDVLIAVAYCTQAPGFEQAIADVAKRPRTRVRILVSSEWQRTNPRFLRPLYSPPRVQIRQIAHSSPGRLHAKAFVGLRSGKPNFAIIGSANVSPPAFSTNREMGVLLSGARDARAILAVREHLEEWFQESKEIDWDEAERIWDERPPGGWGVTSAEEPQDKPLTTDETATRKPKLWVMKMRTQDTGLKPWETANKDGDLILGWAVGGGEELRRVLSGKRPKRGQSFWSKHRGGLSLIRHFWTDIHVHDRVLIVTGWSSSKRGTVRLYGWAEVLEDARTSPAPSWNRNGDGWRYRRAARIKDLKGIEKPVSLLRELLGKKSCLNTIHATDKDFRDVARKLGVRHP